MASRLMLLRQFAVAAAFRRLLRQLTGVTQGRTYIVLSARQLKGRGHAKQLLLRDAFQAGEALS